LSSGAKKRSRKRRSEPELKIREWPTKGWKTSDDLPPLSALAEKDPFFRRVEHYVRVTKVAEHGISELQEEVVPIVAYAEVAMPPWTPETRAIKGANAMVTGQRDPVRLWRLWSIDVLDAAGVLATKDLYLANKVELDLNKLDQSFAPFTREQYAADVFMLLLHAAKAAEGDNPSEAVQYAFDAGMVVREYAIKITREADVSVGERVGRGRKSAIKESSEVRKRTSAKNCRRWTGLAREYLRRDPRARYRGLAAYIKAADPKERASVETIRKCIARVVRLPKLGKERRKMPSVG
jgi:hypothetical protein